MTESFLYYIWKNQQFDAQNLRTDTQKNVKILEIGTQNTQGGADFQDAKLLIDEQIWFGTIEIHVKTSDWHKHQHQKNKQYNNVILHLVWEDDINSENIKPENLILRHDGTTIPTLSLKNRVKPYFVQNFLALNNQKNTILCQSQLQNVPDLYRFQALDKSLAQRLEQKADFVRDLLNQNEQDWEETAFQVLAKNFGFKTNAEPFLRLAKTISYKVLAKHADNLTSIEALLFGQAGFLDGILDNMATDDYTKLLQKEHDFLAKKFNLQQQKSHVSEWQFLRMRPANFPTLRIAQFASLVHHWRNFFSVLLYENYENLHKKFAVLCSEYWHTHYHFGKIYKGKVPQLGKSSVENIFVNTVIPLRVAYSKAKNQPDMLAQSLEDLEKLTAEKNAILDTWHEAGIKAKNAFDAQALLGLYQNFCTPKLCLECPIGHFLLNRKDV